MTVRTGAILVSLLVLAVAAPSQLFANAGGDRVQFFQSVAVGADEHVGEVVCMFCSIRLAGTSSGDVVSIFGNIIVDGTVNGDVVSVGGGVKLNEDARVGGDAVAIGRGLYRHPDAAVKGEIVSQSGPVLLVGLIIAPLLPFILVIALVVWLIRRKRYPAQPQVAYRR